MKGLVLNFGTPSTKFFFALIKKIFLQTLVEIIFKIIKIFKNKKGFGPTGTSYRQKEKKLKFHIQSFGYQMVKRVCGVHFLRNFGEIFKNKDFGFDMFEEGQILKPFSGLTLKTEI